MIMKNIAKQSNKHPLLLLFGLVLAAAYLPLAQTQTASASCGWSMAIGDEKLPCGQGSNSSGTAKGEFIGEDWKGYYKITLNNYHGGAFFYACSGTASSCSMLADTQKVVFELIGENVITAPEGFGIDSFVPIEFTGQGSLKIEAKIPVGGSFFCEWSGTPDANQTCSIDETVVTGIEQPYLSTLVITPRTVINNPSEDQPNPDENDTPTEDDKTSSDDEDKNKCPDSILPGQTSDSDWTVWDIVAIVYIGLSLITFIGLAIRWLVKRKKSGSSKPTTPHTPESTSGSSNTSAGQNTSNAQDNPNSQSTTPEAQ